MQSTDVVNSMSCDMFDVIYIHVTGILVVIKFWWAHTHYIMLELS